MCWEEAPRMDPVGVSASPSMVGFLGAVPSGLFGHRPSYTALKPPPAPYRCPCVVSC